MEPTKTRPAHDYHCDTTASAGFVGSFTPVGVHQPVAGRNAHPILLVPVSALHAVFMELDGSELNMPTPQQKGGARR